MPKYTKNNSTFSCTSIEELHDHSQNYYNYSYIEYQKVHVQLFYVGMTPK